MDQPRNPRRSVSPTGGWAPLRLRNLILDLVVALCLALLIWVYMRSRNQGSLDDVEVPVQIAVESSIAGDYELEILGSSRMAMSFEGPPSRIRELRGKLQRGLVQATIQVTVPEERRKDSVYRGVARIEAATVPVPLGVTTVIAEGRNSIAYTLNLLAERHLPVRLDYTGETRISQITLDPATVVVRGPKEVLDRARMLATQPYELPVQAQTPGKSDGIVSGKASLVRELEGRSIKTTPSAVTFSLRMHPRQRNYELKDVPIHFLCPPDFSWRPRFVNDKAGKVHVEVVGPAADQPPQVLAFVDLTRGELGLGRNSMPLRVHMPREFQLVGEARTVSFVLDPVERPATDE